MPKFIVFQARRYVSVIHDHTENTVYLITSVRETNPSKSGDQVVLPEKTLINPKFAAPKYLQAETRR